MFELIIIRWIFWYMCRDKCNIKYDKIKNGEIKKKRKRKNWTSIPAEARPLLSSSKRSIYSSDFS